MNPLTSISQCYESVFAVCGNSGVEQNILVLVKQDKNTVYVHACCVCVYTCVTQHGNAYVDIQSK